MKVLVKHVLALVILVPLFVLALPIWLTGGDPAAKLFTLFPVLVVSLLFVSPLNRPRVLRFRGLANLLGAGLPIASLFLPYSFRGSYPQYPLGPWAVSQGVPHLILVGSLLTLFFRFGSTVTFAGLLDASSTPTYFCAANGCPPFAFGPGYWVAWAGAIVSLLGRSWILIPKGVEGRTFLGAILFPLGPIVAILGGVFTSAWFNNSGRSFLLFPIFIVTGFFLSGAGLNLFFRSESTTMSRISRALQKPLW